MLKISLKVARAIIDRKSFSSGNTSVYPTRCGSGMVYRLWKTEIVTLYPDRIKLNSGGYETVTTKRRMNDLLTALGLPLSVYQRDFVWYVSEDMVGKFEFYDGDMFDYGLNDVSIPNWVNRLYGGTLHADRVIPYSDKVKLTNVWHADGDIKTFGYLTVIDGENGQYVAKEWNSTFPDVLQDHEKVIKI